MIPSNDNEAEHHMHGHIWAPSSVPSLVILSCLYTVCSILPEVAGSVGAKLASIAFIPFSFTFLTQSSDHIS